jgi:hypothetical protein
MTYTLLHTFHTQNYTLLHTGLTTHLHTFTHHPIGVCKVCKCVVWFFVCSWFSEDSMKMLFRKEMTSAAWRAKK